MKINRYLNQINKKKKNIIIFFLFMFAAYSRITIGSSWDESFHLLQGKITSDYLIKRPAYGGSGLYSKIKLVSGGSGDITHNIFREFKDSNNWTSGGVLVKVLSRSYNTPNFDYAEFLCRYGAYGGSTTAVDVKVAPHSSSNIPTPAYSSQSTLSGNTVYRDVSIVTGYYRVLVIEIVTSMGQVYTSTAGGNGTIYYH